VNSALIKSEAMLNGFDDAIVLNQDGHVSEGSAANFMMIRDGALVTPPITANLLEGITRRTILHLAREELGLEVIERDIDRSELYIVEEAFYCGTGAQVAAIGSIDHRIVGDGATGPITQQIRDLYFRVVLGQEQKYMHWLSPVSMLESV
jgi:branched-chain amino acid aminotransferase